MTHVIYENYWLYTDTTIPTKEPSDWQQMLEIAPPDMVNKHEGKITLEGMTWLHHGTNGVSRAKGRGTSLRHWQTDVKLAKSSFLGKRYWEVGLLGFVELFWSEQMTRSAKDKDIDICICIYIYMYMYIYICRYPFCYDYIGTSCPPWIEASFLTPSQPGPQGLC